MQQGVRCPSRLALTRSAPVRRLEGCNTSESFRAQVIVPPTPNGDTDFPHARYSGERDLKVLDSEERIHPSAQPIRKPGRNCRC